MTKHILKDPNIESDLKAESVFFVGEGGAPKIDGQDFRKAEAWINLPGAIDPETQRLKGPGILYFPPGGGERHDLQPEDNPHLVWYPFGMDLVAQGRATWATEEEVAAAKKRKPDVHIMHAPDAAARGPVAQPMAKK